MIIEIGNTAEVRLVPDTVMWFSQDLTGITMAAAGMLISMGAEVASKTLQEMTGALLPPRTGNLGCINLAHRLFHHNSIVLKQAFLHCPLSSCCALRVHLRADRLVVAAACTGFEHCPK